MPTKTKPKTGPEVIDQMAAKPNADRFFQTVPKFTDAELEEFIAIKRAERAQWETKK